MAKVTSKLQVTIPKAIAREYGIEPGDEIDFQPAGSQIRVVPGRMEKRGKLSTTERLRLFDLATARQRERETEMKRTPKSSSDRGWTREDLYLRGEPR